MTTMSKTGILIRNTAAVLAGLVAGGILNMALVSIGPRIIPPPEGGDITTMEGLRSTIHLFEPRHFIFPFLAHATGSLMGAWVAARLCATRPLTCSMVVGLLFLIGGATMAFSLPEAVAFNVIDLAVAYLPMVWLGYRLSGRKT
jgi:hypothetical protein